MKSKISEDSESDYKNSNNNSWDIFENVQLYTMYIYATTGAVQM